MSTPITPSSRKGRSTATVASPRNSPPSPPTRRASSSPASSSSSPRMSTIAATSTCALQHDFPDLDRGRPARGDDHRGSCRCGVHQGRHAGVRVHVLGARIDVRLHGRRKRAHALFEPEGPGTAHRWPSRLRRQGNGPGGKLLGVHRSNLHGRHDLSRSGDRQRSPGVHKGFDPDLHLLGRRAGHLRLPSRRRPVWRLHGGRCPHDRGALGRLAQLPAARARSGREHRARREHLHRRYDAARDDDRFRRRQRHARRRSGSAAPTRTRRSPSSAGSTAGAFSGCNSGKVFSGLAAGPHTIRVRAKDKAGNLDPTPASQGFSV